MRKGMGWLALVLGLAWVVPASAQVKTLMPGGPPAKIINKPLDLSSTVAPVLPSATERPFSLTRFIPKIFRPGSSAKVGISALPPPGAYPSTSYKNAITPVPYPLGKK